MSHGDVGSATWAKGETAWRLFELGRWDEVIEVADELAKWEEEHGQAQPGVISGIEKMHVLTHRGSHEEAARLEEGLLPRAREISDPQVLWQALVVASVAHLGRGARDGARSMVEELVEVTVGQSAGGFYLIPEGLRVMMALGEVEMARRLVDEAVVAIPTVITRQVVVRAALAEADGNPEAAVEGYREAAAAWKRGGFVFEQANALLGAGRCLLSLGNAGEASRELSSARELFASLRAEPLLRECDDLLGEATALTS